MKIMIILNRMVAAWYASEELEVYGWYLSFSEREKNIEL